ncbi:hypothetical protein [Gilvimarinus chinensis]|uniref:hypothetical protein n=1 Tax=Gilvimarinus chinensis TaxID=396005 RepID=UPI00036A0E0A|nr:hypothetical protein [Gilvimarinus chinensis]
MITSAEIIKFFISLFFTFTILLVSNIALSDGYEPAVINPYKGEFHWSLPPDIPSLMALEPASKLKLDNCVAMSLDAGTGAEAIYEAYVLKGKDKNALIKRISINFGNEGYTPKPKQAIKAWEHEPSNEDAMKVLKNRAVDVMWGYYKEYDEPSGTSEKTSSAQKVIWDYCMSIPKERFLE